ncbi:MAG TPA: hypothetical protein VML55_24385 [Planctomycetaceae bacterium]|nr:hypothetical protein [Planctomycetaceae bacterium]
MERERQQRTDGSGDEDFFAEFHRVATELGRVPRNRDLRRLARISDHRFRWRFGKFEHRSRKFREHGHDPAGCDLVVCWRHDWPDCPVEVLELSRVLEAAHVRHAETRRGKMGRGEAGGSEAEVGKREVERRTSNR